MRPEGGAVTVFSLSSVVETSFFSGAAADVEGGVDDDGSVLAGGLRSFATSDGAVSFKSATSARPPWNPFDTANSGTGATP